MAGIQQFVCQVGTNKSCAAGDKDTLSSQDAESLSEKFSIPSMPVAHCK